MLEKATNVFLCALLVMSSFVFTPAKSIAKTDDEDQKIARVAQVTKVIGEVIVIRGDGELDDEEMSQERMARPSSRNNVATIETEQVEKEISAFEGMSLIQGDEIRTGENSLVTIAFSEGTETSLGSHAELVIEQLEDDPSKSLFTLWAGQMWSKVKRLFNIEDEYEVETPTAIMGVRGTHFLVHVDRTGQRENLSVFDGIVSSRSEEKVISPAEYDNYIRQYLGDSVGRSVVTQYAQQLNRFIEDFKEELNLFNQMTERELNILINEKLQQADGSLPTAIRERFEERVEVGQERETFLRERQEQELEQRRAKREEARQAFLLEQDDLSERREERPQQREERTRTFDSLRKSEDEQLITVNEQWSFDSSQQETGQKEELDMAQLVEETEPLLFVPIVTDLLDKANELAESAIQLERLSEASEEEIVESLLTLMQSTSLLYEVEMILALIQESDNYEQIETAFENENISINALYEEASRRNNEVSVQIDIQMEESIERGIDMEEIRTSLVERFGETGAEFISSSFQEERKAQLAEVRERAEAAKQAREWMANIAATNERSEVTAPRTRPLPIRPVILRPDVVRPPVAELPSESEEQRPQDEDDERLDEEESTDEQESVDEQEPSIDENDSEDEEKEEPPIVIPPVTPPSPPTPPTAAYVAGVVNGETYSEFVDAILAEQFFNDYPNGVVVLYSIMEGENVDEWTISDDRNVIYDAPGEYILRFYDNQQFVTLVESITFTIESSRYVPPVTEFISGIESGETYNAPVEINISGEFFSFYENVAIELFKEPDYQSPIQSWLYGDIFYPIEEAGNYQLSFYDTNVNDYIAANITFTVEPSTAPPHVSSFVTGIEDGATYTGDVTGTVTEEFFNTYPNGRVALFSIDVEDILMTIDASSSTREVHTFGFGAYELRFYDDSDTLIGTIAFVVTLG